MLKKDTKKRKGYGLLILLVLTMILFLNTAKVIAPSGNLSEINLEISFYNNEIKNLSRNPITFSMPVRWNLELDNSLNSFLVSYETPSIYTNTEEQILEDNNWQQTITFITEYSGVYNNVSFDTIIPYSSEVYISPNITHVLNEQNLTIIIPEINSTFEINIFGKMQEKTNETLYLPTTIQNNYFSNNDSFLIILEIPGRFKNLAFEINKEETDISKLLNELEKEIPSTNLNLENITLDNTILSDSITNSSTLSFLIDPANKLVSSTIQLIESSFSSPNLESENKLIEIQNKIESVKSDKIELEQSMNNKFNATLILEKGYIKKIKFTDLKIKDNSVDLGIKEISSLKKEIVQAYAIDPEKMNFTNAIVTSVARGNYLYKCKDWDFEKQICPKVTKTCFGVTKDDTYCVVHGGWKKVMKIEPGKEYYFTLSLKDPGFAEYSSTYTAPYCDKGESPCIANSSLLKCRDNVGDGNGPEPNSPNTIDSCSDGTQVYEDPSCGGDESVESITIESLNNSYFMKGDTVRVNGTVHCWGTGASDNVNLAYTNNASDSAPSWSVKDYDDPCPGGGYQDVSYSFVLDNQAGDHAVRLLIQYNGATTTTCATGDYEDNDDLVFKVHDYPTTAPFVKNITAENITLDNSVEITANVTIDPSIYYYDLDIDYVKATIDHSNGSQTNITMTDGNLDGIYNCTFSETDILGKYNITIWANDTLNNINNTEDSSFYVTYRDLDLETNKQSYVITTNVLATATGFTSYNNVTIMFYDPTMDPISGYPKNVSSNSTGSINFSWIVTSDTGLGTYTINATDTINSSRSITTTFDVVTAIIEANFLSYFQGDLVNISGNSWDNNVNVTVDIICPSCESVLGYPKNITTNSTGYINDSWQVPYNASLGIFNLTAIQPSDQSKKDAYEFSVIKIPISLKTDSSWYKRSEIIYFNASRFSITSNITVDIINSSGSSVGIYPKNVTSDGEGFANDSWIIPGTQKLGVYIINMTDYNYQNINNITTINIVVPNISTSSGAYSSGESVVIGGVYWDRDTNVTLDITNSSGISVSGYPKNVSVDSFGELDDSWVAQPGAGLGIETYNLSAWQALDFGENSTVSFDVTKIATLSTNKYYYDQNELVNITGSFYSQTDDVEISIKKISDSSSAQGYPKIIQSDSLGNIENLWNTSIFSEGKYVVKAIDQNYPSTLFANVTFEIYFTEKTISNYNFSTTSDKSAYDNNNLDAGENIPPAGWDDINNLDPWYACYQPQGDADELTGTQYTDISSDNSVYYMFRGTNGDYACLGTEWTINEDEDFINLINITLDGYIQTTNSHINVYARNWTSGNWNYLTRWTISSTSGPGETKNIQVNSGFKDYFDGNDKIRIMFIVEERNIDYYSDYVFVNVDYQSHTSKSYDVFDTTKPTVSDITITPDTQSLVNSVIVKANVSDANNVSFVKAIVDMNNGSQFDVVLSDPNEDGRYNGTFTNTYLLGQYNVTIWANDTWNNINNTETSNFTVTYRSLYLITNKQSYVKEGDVLISGTGFSPNVNITIDIYNSSNHSVSIYPINVTSNVSGGITDSWLIPGAQKLGEYFITATDTINSTRTYNTSFKIVTAIIETDSSNYAQGDLVNIIGRVWDNNVNVTVDIQNPSKISVFGYPKNITTNFTGYLNDTWQIPYDATLGNYNLSGIQPSNPGKNNEFIFSISKRSVNVETNYSWYKRKDVVESFAQGFSNFSTIDVDIFNSSNISVSTYPDNVQSNSTGHANDSWTLSVTQNLGIYTINMTDSNYNNLNNKTEFSIVLQNISTNSGAYSSGDNVVISGVYWDRDTNVTLNIVNSSGVSVSGYPKNVSVDSFGELGTYWVAQPGAGLGVETYNLSAWQALDLSENSTVSFDVTKVATLSTNKNDYSPDENINITGSFYAPTDYVQINIKSLDNKGHAITYPKLISSDGLGDITHNWNVSTYCDGEYIIETIDQTYPEQLFANKTFNIIYNDETDKTCTQVWGQDCSLWPAGSEGDNTFNDCATSASTSIDDEHVDGGSVSMTVANPGDSVSVTCNFVPYGSGGTELYIYYYNTSGWTNLYTASDSTGSPLEITRSVNIHNLTGTHWFRCIADWDGTGATCEGGSYFDHDDINVSVMLKPSSCDVFDIIKPNVTNILPSQDSNYNLSDNIVINTTIVDNTNISQVIAIINHSNGSQTNITMTDDDSDDIYNCTFTDTLVIGRYNITIWTNDTWNNINNTETTYFNVNDVINPTWSNNVTSPISPIIYSPSQNYQFNITWSENYEIDTIQIEHNFTGISTNYSITGNSTDVYYYNYPPISAGSYNWKMNANDTSGNFNVTDEFTYIIQKASPTINLTLNSIEDNLTIEVHSIVNVTANVVTPMNVNAELYENSILINNGSSPLTNLTNYTSLGKYNLTMLFPTNQNYTVDSQTWWLTIEDTTNPKVTNLWPDSEKLNTSEIINISSKVIDNYQLDNVFANITWISGNELIKLKDSNANNYYNKTFTNTAKAGRYHYTIIANDTSNNINNTENNYFILLDDPEIILNKQSYVRGGIMLIKGKGFNLNVNVTIDIYNDSGVSVSGYPKNVSSNSTGELNDSWPIPGGQPLGIYIINMSDTTEIIRQVNKSFDIVTAVVESELDNYEQGDVINITGYNWNNNVNVTLDISCMSCGAISGYPKNISSNSTGEINDSWNIPYDAFTEAYTISGIQPSNPSKNDTFIFNVNVRPVSVNINYTWYKRNDNVSIVGTGFSPNNNVTIDVYGDRIRSITIYPKEVESNTSGGIIDSFIIPGDQQFAEYVINATDNNYSNLQNITTFEIVIQNLSSNSDSYSSGDLVTIIGYYWNRNSNVTVDIKNGSGGSASGYPKNISVGDDGILSDSWISEPSFVNSVENYDYNAEQAENPAVSDTINFDVTRVATLNTDKQVYDQNEIINITGSYYSSNTDVKLTINCLDNGGIAPYYPKLIQSDSSGNINELWNSSDACEGNYSIDSIDQNYPKQLFANATFFVNFMILNNSVETATTSTLTGNYNKNGGSYSDTHTSNNVRQYFGAQDLEDELHSWINYSYDISSLNIYSISKINKLSLSLEYCYSGDQVGLSCGAGHPAEGEEIGTQDIEIWNFTSLSWQDFGNINFDNESDSENIFNHDFLTGFSDLISDDNLYFRLEMNFNHTDSEDSFLLVDYLGLNVSYSSHIDRNCTVFDVTSPNITILSPLNNSGNIDGNITFEYNVSDFSHILNCSLIINDKINLTNYTIEKDILQTFELNNVPIAGYDWEINCVDNASTRNVGSSGLQRVSVIYSTDYPQANMTNLSQVDVSNITNLYIFVDNEAKLNFTEQINLTDGADLNEIIEITNNSVSVNSTYEQRLNVSATITLYDLGYKLEPLPLRNGIFCPSNICAGLDYNSVTGEFTFNVTHFTTYSATSNSELVIWDETDVKEGSKVRYLNDDIEFYANYTNKTNGNVITGVDVICNFTHNNSGVWSSPISMNYDGAGELHKISESFSNNGTFYFNITCYNNQGYENISAIDSFLVIHEPDLTIQGFELSDSEFIEGKNLTLSVNITNLGSKIAENFTLQINVSLWNGTKNWNESLEDITISLSGKETEIINFSWIDKIGTYIFDIYADVKNNVSEHNETNNNYVTNITTSSWEIFYGDYNYSITLENSLDNSLYNWTPSVSRGNIFYSDYDASYYPFNLEPLTGPDFVDADAALGLTGFNDSIKALFDTDGNDIPDNTKDIEIWGSIVNNIPIVESTLGSAFITGLLWDSADGASYTGVEDLIIITIINESQAGKYGTYDYEIKIPSTLGDLVDGLDLVVKIDELI